jgi:rhodanese-related sulfurtransferase
LAARKAEKLGYTNVKIFHAGLPAWKKAGHASVSNIAAIENFDKQNLSYILLDLRPKNVVDQGHIPNAIALPEKGLEALKDQFPKFKSAPIILYNQDGKIESALDAYKTISGWEYKQVSILNVGFQGWEKAGKQVTKDPAQEKIQYVRKLGPGEIDFSTFKAQIEKPASNIVILDVRNAPEAATGKIPNSINIPMEELESRIAEVPKDKVLYLHCATGARAEMAYNVLKKAGLDPKFIKAKVEFDKDDNTKYTIEE